MKKSSTNCFGKNLAKARRARGLTMRQLAKMTGISARMIAYYETEEGSPPVHRIAPFVKALKISADELLGIKEFKHPFESEEHAALWRKLKKAALLSQRDQQGLIHYLNSMLDKKKNKTRSHL